MKYLKQSCLANRGCCLPLKSDGPMNDSRQPVFLHEISTINVSYRRVGGLMNNGGILSNNCLPCLASIVYSVDKRSSTTPSVRKKVASKLAFKWRDGYAKRRKENLHIDCSAIIILLGLILCFLRNQF